MSRGSDSDFRNRKKCSVFPSSYGNTSRSLGEQEMLWEHESQACVSTAFLSFPKLSHACSFTNFHMHVF